MTERGRKEGVVRGGGVWAVQCYVENILISIAKENACTHLKIVYAPYTFASEGKLKLD